MKNRRRILALLMALCMVAGMLPVSANAAACEHHLEHTPECGYAAAQPCGHSAHTEACYTVTCTHVHNAESCGYDETTGEGCAYVHGDCDSSTLNCPHEAGVHEGCGYSVGSDCLYSCPTCAQAAYEAELAKCNQESGCTATVHHPACAKDIADKEAAEREKCDLGEQCPAMLHKDGCARAAYEAELARCDGGENCPSTVHKDTCVKYVWPCTGAADCKAADHAGTCPVAVKAENLKIFEEMVAKLPAPDQVDPQNLEQIQALTAEIQAIIAFAEEKGLYTQAEVTAMPAIAALLEAMNPTDPTLVIGNIELDFTWYTDPGAETFTISTVGQLAAFAKMTQGDVKADDGTLLASKNSFAGKTIMLGDNITFADNQYWYRVDGVAENKADFRIYSHFTGSFDGNGKTITGLKFKNTDIGQNPEMYLFKTIAAGSSVKNLTLNTVTADINGYDNFGFIARTLTGTAENCHVKNVVVNVAVANNGKGYVSSSGAMFGSVSSATIENCTASNVKFTCDGIDNADNVGALIGNAGGTAEKPTTVTNCSVTDITFDFTQKTKRTGGFIGSTGNAIFTGCTATNVKISVDNYYQHVGGFAGGVGSNTTFTGCNVVGVTMDCDVGAPYPENYAYVAGYAGGFAAYTSGSGIAFTDCSVTGLDMDLEIDDRGGLRYGQGGFVGSQEGASAYNDCSVTGDITATGENKDHSIGGFMGVTTTAAANVNGCVANVDVSTFGTAGGFVGKGSGGTFTDCKATGAVTSTNGVAGGLVGYVPSGSNIVLNNDCTPSTQVSGEITNPIANAQDREYETSNGIISTMPAVCSGTVDGYEIGFPTIQEALDEGVETVTLLTNLDEDLSLDHNLVLNLGAFTLNSTITIPDGTFTVPGDHDVDKDPKDIQGVKVSVTGTSSNNAIILAEPVLDHHVFQGWCSSETEVPNCDTLKVDGGWQAVPGFTYHTHWKHSSYVHLPSEQLHLTFRMTYGEATDEEKSVTFQPSTEGSHAITDFDQGQYFTVRKENLTVYLTPNAQVVSRLNVNAYGYEDVIHVTVEDGSVHTIHATLIVTQAESAITPQPSEGSTTVTGVYGDTIALSVKVAARPRTRTLGADQMVFLYNGQQLAEPVPVVYQADGSGTAGILYETAGGILPVGTSTVDVQYGGGNNLLPSVGTITVTLTAKEVAGDETYTAPDGTTVTGPATFDQDGIHVSTGGKLTVGGVEYQVTKGTVTLDEGVLTIPSGSAVTDGVNTIAGAATVNPSSATQTYPAGSTVVAGGTTLAVTTGSVTMGADGSLTIPTGTTVTIDGQTITGPAAVGADGTVTVQTGGTITEDGKTYTVTTGSVTVDNGTIQIPAGSTVSDGKNTIAGPATADPSGDTQTYPAGSTVVVGDTNVTVSAGTVTVGKDGTLTVPSDAAVTVDGVTVTGPATVDADGAVTAGTGSQVTVGGETFTVTTGSVTVQDGTVTVPTGSTVTDGSGAVHTGPKQLDDEGVHTVIPQGGTTSAGDKDITATQGEILKKEDGSVEIPDGSSAQVGGQTITGPASVDANGSVTVDQGGTVGTGSTAVEVTQGSVNVKDDGTVEVLPGSKVETGDKTVTGPADITKDGEVTVEAGGSVTTGGNTVTVTTGTATVKPDGTVDIPAGSSAVVNGQSVTGPATVNKDGSVTIGSGGKANVNGETYTVTNGSATVNKDGSLTLPTGSTLTDGNGNPITGPKLIDEEGIHTIYTILSGARQTVTRGNEATFSSSADIGKFLRVEVDGAEIARSSYTLTEGSTVVTLKASYVKTLSLGTHTLRIVSTDGFADTTFTLKARTYHGSDVWYDSDSPRTGDTTNTGMWYALAMIGLLGMTAALTGKKYLRKRK